MPIPFQQQSVEAAYAVRRKATRGNPPAPPAMLGCLGGGCTPAEYRHLCCGPPGALPAATGAAAGSAPSQQRNRRPSAQAA